MTLKMGRLGIRKRWKSTPPAYRTPKNWPPGVCMPNSKILTEALYVTVNSWSRDDNHEFTMRMECTLNPAYLRSSVSSSWRHCCLCLHWIIMEH